MPALAWIDIPPRIDKKLSIFFDILVKTLREIERVLSTTLAKTR